MKISELGKELEFLSHTSCQSLNISLDSLNKEKFNRITKRKYFDDVMSSILRAKEMGFKVKINAILMRGLNSDEILDFVAFSARTNIEVRFLELMRIGQANPKQEMMFMPAAEAIDIIKQNEKEIINLPLEKAREAWMQGLGDALK